MSSEEVYKKALAEGCEQLDLSLSEQQLKQLLDYHGMLVKWNRAYNLTAVRDPLQMIPRHLLDSLSIAPYLQGEDFIDVGTGAGLPGLVMAIVFPERHFHLLDSAGKKTRFLFQVKTQLALDNVEIHNGRVESYHPERQFDGVISRAFASLADMVGGCEHLLKPAGRFYAMKGLYPDEELEQLKKLSDGAKDYKVEACHVLRVPGEQGQRHLLLITR